VNGKPPSVLDIGCGRGGFLLAHALSFPNENVLGIEVRKMLVDWITGVAKGEGLGNVHAEWYSVVNGLRWIPSNSLLKTSYLFPDPWPKKRHYKRRAFSVAFLEEVHRVLHADGTLYLATDRVDVDTHQRSVFRVHGGFELTDIAEATEHLWPFPFSTDQQLFCERKGIGYHRYIARKK